LVADTSSQAPESQTDGDLVRLVVQGSAEALASIYDRHVRDVYALANRTTRDASLAGDVVQETFLALWDRAELFDPTRGSLRGWLLAIARNRAIDHVRYASRHDRALAFSAFGTADQDDGSVAGWLTDSGVLVATGAPDPGPETAVVNLETRAVVADAIASLAPVERSVILLAYGSHLSQVEIADRLGWPLGTVKTRTRRALRHLRERLVPPSAGANRIGGVVARAGTRAPVESTTCGA
jgi:RNA polymerase sigma-70 factor (ECF subfamily)